MDSANLQSVLPDLLAIPIPRAVENALERALGIREIRRVYDQVAGDGIAERLLEFLEVAYRVAPRDLEQVPRTGAAVMVVNHPYGVLEGAALAVILRRVRSDVKFLANGILTAIPEVRDMVIAVDPVRQSAGNSGGLRRAVRHLESGGMLVIFPAGEVSHFQIKRGGVADPRWSESVARMIAMAARRAPALQVLPAHVDGANSLIFQLAGLLHPRLRTALLARELLNKRGASVEIRIGNPVAASRLLAIPSDRERIEYLRWRTYLLAERNSYKPRTNLPLPGRRGAATEPVAAAGPAEAIALEVGRLAPDRLMARSGDLAAYLARAGEIPRALRELGRLREISFRAAGEGTGRSSDLDGFDLDYLHLFLWNEKRREIAGAYRLAGTDAGHALYTATLFRYGPEFPRRIGPALELGRSFIRPEYQRSFSPLLLLWKGIGKFLARNPRYRVLFGPVSISNQYGPVSRRLMVSFLERHAFWKELASLVTAANPPRQRETLPVERLDLDDLADAVADVEPSKAGVPVLLRQYLKLGGKLLGFHVDRKFSDSLDGLIVVDLDSAPRKLLERYLGTREAERFLGAGS